MFLKRFSAYMIDILILTIVTLIINFIFDKFDLFYLYTRSLIFYIIYILYFSIQESSSYQATFGKRILKLVVCNLNGEKISFKIALLRNFARIINDFILALGYFIIIFTKNHRGLHDYISKTLVVNEVEYFD